MKVMIVDDNHEVRQMVINFLHSPHNQFFECSNGKEAVKYFAAARPDLVLMDIEMDKYDGITASKEIIKDFPGANIIILTQYDDNHLREAAIKAGAKGYFLKENLASLQRFIIQHIHLQYLI